MGKKQSIVFKMIALYILFPVILFFIPLSSFNNLPSLCLYKNLFRIECPGCGITRAVLSLIHFHFFEAITYNKLIVIVFPLLIYLFIRQFIYDIIKIHRIYKNNQPN